MEYFREKLMVNSIIPGMDRHNWNWSGVKLKNGLEMRLGDSSHWGTWDLVYRPP